GHGAGIIRRTTSNISDSDSHSITRESPVPDAHKHVANVREIIRQADYDGHEPRLIWNRSDMFHGEWINVMFHIFSIGSYSSSSFAWLKLQVLSEQHHARLVV